MRKIDEQKLLRIVDANLNRAKEGLRVCEDICRFVLNDKRHTLKYKGLRHTLTRISRGMGMSKLVNARDTEKDVGKRTSYDEGKRGSFYDVFYANSQRVKESVRVLEEFAKLNNRMFSRELKKLRYNIYAIEKKIIKSF